MSYYCNVNGDVTLKPEIDQEKFEETLEKLKVAASCAMAKISLGVMSLKMMDGKQSTARWFLALRHFRMMSFLLN